MKPALMVMDFINEIVHEKGKIGQMGYAQYVNENKVFENVKKLIQKARAKNIPIIFVRVGYSPDYREWSAIPRMFQGAKQNELIKLGTWATEFHSSIDVQPHDYIVTKHRINPFYSTNLQVILRSLGVDTLYLAGVSTNYVVQSMAREGHDRDFNVVLVPDCCGAATRVEHERAVESLQFLTYVKNSTQLEFGEKDLS